MIRKNIISYAAAIMIVVGAFSGVGIFFWINKKNQESKLKNQEVFNVKNDSSKIDIFPNLIKDNYYDYLKIKEGKPFVGDEFIAKVVNDVIKNMKVTDGNLDLSWEFNDSKKITFIFRWINMHQEEYWKTYTFYIESPLSY